MKALVLAAGEGTRLRPLTSKHAEAAADDRRQALPVPSLLRIGLGGRGRDHLVGRVQEQPHQGVLRRRQQAWLQDQIPRAEGTPRYGSRHRHGGAQLRRGLHVRQRGRSHIPQGRSGHGGHLRPRQRDDHGGGQGAGPPPFRRHRREGRQDGAHRGEAQGAAHRPHQRGHLHLHTADLRSHRQDRQVPQRGVRDHRHPQHAGEAGGMCTCRR